MSGFYGSCAELLAVVWGAGAVVWGSGAAVWGSGALVWVSGTVVWCSGAVVWTRVVDMSMGPIVRRQLCPVAAG